MELVASFSNSHIHECRIVLSCLFCKSRVYFLISAPKSTNNLELHRYFLLSLIHIYDIPISTLPPLYPYLSLSIAWVFLLYLSATSSPYARYLFGIIPNIYWTSTGHLPNMNRSHSLTHGDRNIV